MEPCLSPGRVVIENLKPDVDQGRFPLVRQIHDLMVIEVDLYADGHDVLAGDVLLTRPDQSFIRLSLSTSAACHDRFESEPFRLDQIGKWSYQIEAWVDRYQTWCHEIEKKIEAGVDVELEFREGALLVESALQQSRQSDTEGYNILKAFQSLLSDRTAQPELKLNSARSQDISSVMRRWAFRGSISQLEKPGAIRVDRQRAVFGAWYEMFPRSTSAVKGGHGTFRDCIQRLDDIAHLGFDVLYLPPIHPIGFKFRKGRNNSLTAEPGDPGSPWAIGSESGGHTEIHPELGTLQDFKELVHEALQKGIEIALDIAFQCSPDHPWLKSHPDWFQIRPDGSIRYAENPPKKYQDIHPLNFECKDWQNLWNALRDVFLYWIRQGVKIFRVDNPHTKPFAFWEWCLEEVYRDHPDVIFLAEAFTRPKLLKRLAKGGFTQSYTYFTWRNDKQGLTEYMTELTTSECREYLRPNFFANTPDILNEFLVNGGPVAFRIRLVLAATLSATYGIYGPPFELCVNTPLKPGSEEYLDSEKYEIRHWNHDQPQSLRPLICRVNQIRRANTALQTNQNLVFHEVSNPALIAYSKVSDDRSDRILVVVNLNPFETSIGTLKIDLSYFDIDASRDFLAHDLLTDDYYRWYGCEQYIEISPDRTAHLFSINQD